MTTPPALVRIRAGLMGVFVVACAGHSAAPRSAEPRPVASPSATFPGKQWQRLARPQDAGWSLSALSAARVYGDSIGTAAVMIVQHGKVVAEWGRTSFRFQSHSM